MACAAVNFFCVGFLSTKRERGHPRDVPPSLAIAAVSLRWRGDRGCGFRISHHLVISEKPRRQR